MSIATSTYSVFPSRVQSDPEDDTPSEIAYEYSVLITTTGYGLWIEFPDNVAGAVVELDINVGSGTIETTCAPVSQIHDGTANGVAWATGTVSSSAQRWIEPRTAVRALNISGMITLNIRFQ